MSQAERIHKSEQTSVEDFLSRTDIKSRQWHLARHERAQEFLNNFARQNEAKLQHITSSAELIPVELGAAHHAVNLELTHHLVANRMNLKKLSKKSTTDKITRLNDSLNGAQSAEEALLNSALLFRTQDGESGLDVLMATRTQQRRETESELLQALAEFEGAMPMERKNLRDLKRTLSRQDYNTKEKERVVTLYDHLVRDIKSSNTLGDDDASQILRRLLSKAERSPDRALLSDIKNLKGAQRERLMKKRLSELCEATRELTLRVRSERFIDAVSPPNDILTLEATSAISCSSPHCVGGVGLDQLSIVTHCGHTACSICLDGRTNDEACVHPGCTALLQSRDLIQVAQIRPAESTSFAHDFGRKLEALVGLIKQIPKDDQGLIFAPNDASISVLEEVLDHSTISYHSLGGSKSRMSSASSKIIEDFKNNKKAGLQKKVLLLNLGSESAAGV